MAPPDKTSCTHLLSWWRYATVCACGGVLFWILCFRCLFDSHAHPFGAIHTYDCHCQITTGTRKCLSTVLHFGNVRTWFSVSAACDTTGRIFGRYSFNGSQNRSWTLEQGLRESQEESESERTILFGDYYFPLLNWATIAVADGKRTGLAACFAAEWKFLDIEYEYERSLGGIVDVEKEIGLQQQQHNFKAKCFEAVSLLLFFSSVVLVSLFKFEALFSNVSANMSVLAGSACDCLIVTAISSQLAIALFVSIRFKNFL